MPEDESLDDINEALGLGRFFRRRKENAAIKSQGADDQRRLDQRQAQLPAPPPPTPLQQLAQPQTVVPQVPISQPVPPPPAPTQAPQSGPLAEGQIGGTAPSGPLPRREAVRRRLQRAQTRGQRAKTQRRVPANRIDQQNREATGRAPFDNRRRLR